MFSTKLFKCKKKRKQKQRFSTFKTKNKKIRTITKCIPIEREKKKTEDRDDIHFIGEKIMPDD